MICRSCTQRVLRRSFHTTSRLASQAGATSTTSPRTNGPPAATSTSAAQPFSTPLTPAPNDISLGKDLRPKKDAAKVLPVSSVPAGKPLKGLGFIKGKDDPVALREDEYPEWLWTLLDKKEGDGAKDDAGDEFSKSKKQRRVAAKRQRKLEEKLIASGNAALLEPKVPLQQQTIDLKSNEEGTVQGALGAVKERENLRKAMRSERRAKIKEANFLKSMN